VAVVGAFTALPKPAVLEVLVAVLVVVYTQTMQVAQELQVKAMQVALAEMALLFGKVAVAVVRVLRA